MKVIGILFAALIGLAALVGVGVALDLFGIFYKKETAGIRGESEAERMIESGTSRMQRYEEFFDLCQGIRSKEFQIDALEKNDQMDSDRKADALTATIISRHNLISEYNSKSARAYTSARFKAEGLPYRISNKPYDGTKTECQ